MDAYLTIAQRGEGNYTEKRSRFLSFALHVENEDDVKDTIAQFRKKYYDARHVCYAYVLGPEKSATRANDDGEPSGSAGKPILGQITSMDLTDTLVVVVRYFGGVKLGTGGLFSAYKIAAKEALNAAEIEERIIKERLKVAVPYADVDVIMRLSKNAGAEIVSREYDAVNTILAIEIRKNEIENLKSVVNKVFTAKILK
ncbi:YigZ family protein [Pseudoprevotella muciniphila]|uniref:YigZ family protein n=1 Tax=Pseudoprevotella muciniphila TaxID=2133944 RepID=A0A5P8E4G5_9BACT|nr:YigZ family protein [Pseudoprevotella muciniphila]QFQ11851.1 YigZ family protein [Pseudoprevotella muciniphila]